MPPTRLLQSVVVAASLLIQACSTAPETVPEVKPEPRTKTVPELTLNLEEKECSCVEQTVLDYTPLERGFTALAIGKHIEAVQHFQRYQRLEKSATADLEASIAIAYISILPASPFYNTDEARKTYRRVRASKIDRMELHEQTLLMRQSLETFLVMERKIVEFEKDNAKLTKELEKREKALQRLRELALGQKARR